MIIIKIFTSFVALRVLQFSLEEWKEKEEGKEKVGERLLGGLLLGRIGVSLWGGHRLVCESWWDETEDVQLGL